MGIEVITNKIPLDVYQQKILTRYVNSNCGYYYLLNFVKITNGNVKDAIKLNEFDQELRNVLLKYILILEIQMKKDFINDVEKSTGSTSFWNNPSFYISSALKIPSGKKYSKFDDLVYKISLNNKRALYESTGTDNNRALYSSSFGTFITLYNYLPPVLYRQFVDKYLSQQNPKGAEDLKAYLLAVKDLRNRCCHNLHIISPKYFYLFSANKLFDLDSNNYGDNLTKILYFIYRNIDNKKVRKSMKLVILKTLKKYKKVWKKYQFKQPISNCLYISVKHC